MTHKHNADDSQEGSHVHDYLVRRDYSASGSSGRPGITNGSGIDLWYSQVRSDIMNAGGSHNHDITVENYSGSTSSTTPGVTGNRDPGDTSNTDPGDTNSKTGLTTAGSGALVTQSAGGNSAGLNYPPFMVANKIIKVV